MGSALGPIHGPLACYVIYRVSRTRRSNPMDGNMRRLPPWMIAGASSGVTATSNRIDDREVKQEAEAPKTKKKRKTRREIDDAEEEHKKLEIRRRGRVGRKIKEEEAKPSIGDDGKSIIQSVTSPEDEDLTVDDLLSFAQEYVKSEEEDQALSTSESMVVDVNDGSNMKASQGETNGTRDPTSDDMISLLLGPFFNTRK